MKRAVLDPNEVVHFDSQLVLHDLGNLAMQVLRVSDDLRDLASEAESLNNCFAQAGRADQFQAEVLKESVPVYRWQTDNRFNK